LGKKQNKVTEACHACLVQSLTELYVQNNNVSGPLPSTWGATDCFASLATLALHNNSLSGSVPTSWGSSTSFGSLADM